MRQKASGITMTARRQKLIITMYPMSREVSHMSCIKSIEMKANKWYGNLNPISVTIYQNTTRGGNHAEARGIQYMINNGIDTIDAKQATSHYSCEDCERKQAFHSVINITEDASDPRNGKKISRRKMEDL